MAKQQVKRPDAFLVDIAAATYEGKTQAEIADLLGITRQALAERLGRNKELYTAIKTAYYEERARIQARAEYNVYLEQRSALDNATSRREVEIAVDNAFYVIKHYVYTLDNDILAREKVEQGGGLPKTADNPEQAKSQLEHNRAQRKSIAELAALAEKLKNRLDDGDITYRRGDPFSD